MGPLVAMDKPRGNLATSRVAAFHTRTALARVVGSSLVPRVPSPPPVHEGTTNGLPSAKKAPSPKPSAAPLSVQSANGKRFVCTSAAAPCDDCAPAFAGTGPPCTSGHSAGPPDTDVDVDALLISSRHVLPIHTMPLNSEPAGNCE